MRLRSLTSEVVTSRRDIDNVIVEQFTLWRAVLEDGNDTREVRLQQTAQPTDDQILAQAGTPARELVPTAATSKAAIAVIVEQRMLLAQAFDWFSTKAQSDAALTAPQKAAIAAEATARYNSVKQAIAAWIQAT